jgi:hypothetical protein
MAAVHIIKTGVAMAISGRTAAAADYPAMARAGACTSRYVTMQLHSAVIRICLVFNRCIYRIRSDIYIPTRRADRVGLALRACGYCHADSLAAGLLGAVKLTVLDYARTQGGPG